MNTQHKKVLTITAVVFVHVAVITLMLAQHGCKSDGAKASTPDAAKPVVVATPAPAPVAVDSTFVAPMRPAPETPVTPIPAGQYSEPLTTEPTPTPQPSAPTVSWVVAKGDSLSSIAKKNGITVEELVSANAPKLTRTSVLKVGQSLSVPSHAPSAQAAETAAPTDGTVYTVQSGDTLSKIASKNGTTVAAIKSLNKLSATTLRAGQKLNLPASSGAPAAPMTPSAADASSGDYTVVAGDSLSKIATKTGVKVAELMKANNLTDASARTLHPGQKLKLPANGHAPDAAMSPTPAIVTSSPSLMPALPAAMNVTGVNVTGVPANTTSAPITPVQ
jgi:LysM repeat protein